MIKAALIGTGGISTAHLTSYKLMENVELAAVADIDTHKAQKKVWPGVKVYDTIDTLLENEQIDLLDICLPTYLHKETAVKAMRKGIHVLCEKPAALNARDAGEMAEEAARNNVKLMIAQVLRFWPEYRYLKAAYAEKQYGRLQEAVFYRYSPMATWSWNDWLLKRELGGISELDLHIHDVDFVLHLLGQPVSIHSTGTENDFASTIETHYHYNQKMIVRSEGGWFKTKTAFHAGYRAVFEKAVLEYKDRKLTVYEQDAGPEEINLREARMDTASMNINISDVLPYYNEINYFTQCIMNGTEPALCMPQSSAESIEMVFREMESKRENSRIRG